VQAAAGILCHVKPGDAVVSGAPLLELHTDTPDAVDGALAALAGAYEITDEAPPTRPLVLETLRG
jgi:thymidine phosphorylase